MKYYVATKIYAWEKFSDAMWEIVRCNVKQKA